MKRSNDNVAWKIQEKGIEERRKKFVIKWFRLAFDKKARPVSEGQVLSELLRIFEQIKKEKESRTISKMG